MIIPILAVIIGTLVGVATGLIPGIHTNLIALLILESSIVSLAFIEPLTLILFLIAMAISHTFLDFIPSIYLGAPNEDTALSVLPGHEYLLKGKGDQAIQLTLIGSAMAIVLLIIVLPIFFLSIQNVLPLVERMMSWILIWISIFLITDNKNKPAAILIFVISGFLGVAALNSNTTQPLFPLLTGLFGTSTLLHSIKTGTIPPKQNLEKLKLNKKEIIKPAIVTTLVSPFCSFLPGLGSSQAAIIGSKISGKVSSNQFLILLGSINTLVIAVSFFTLYLINKSRTGIASAISNITNITTPNLLPIGLTIIFSSLIAIPITLLISKKFAKNIHRIPYTKVSKLIALFLIIITFFISGPLGLLILLISTALGLLCILMGVRRSLAMGCLLIPTILFYWPF